MPTVGNPGLNHQPFRKERTMDIGSFEQLSFLLWAGCGILPTPMS